MQLSQQTNEYLRSLLPPRSRTAVLDFAEENSVPIIYPEAEQFLRVLLQIQKPKTILEIGTAIGYSAIFMSEITKAEITTIEISDEMVDLAKNFIGDNSKINILRGDAAEVLPTLMQKFDFVFLDSSKSHYLELLPELVRLLNEDGLLVCDNVLFKGLVIAPEYPEKKHRTTVRCLREFLKELSNHPDLETTILPIGDGMSLSRRKS